MLINELSEKKFNPVQFKDEYRERLLDRIRAKSRGKTIVAEEKEEEKGGEVIDIMEALRRSLEGGSAKSKRPARRAAKSSRTRAKTTSKKRKAS
jgi:DNA end-binding protein Ku